MLINTMRAGGHMVPLGRWHALHRVVVVVEVEVEVEVESSSEDGSDLGSMSTTIIPGNGLMP